MARRPPEPPPQPPPPPPGAPRSKPVGLAPPFAKRQLLENLRQSDKKFRKPFESGNLTVLNLLGGDWNDYAQIVLNMVIADTLLNIEEQLAALSDRLAQS